MRSFSNFLRRGGSPNTAKQSASSHAVKYGYGMIHALIVIKAPRPLDLLLQQGANPNVISLGQTEEDKVNEEYKREREDVRPDVCLGLAMLLGSQGGLACRTSKTGSGRWGFDVCER